MAKKKPAAATTKASGHTAGGPATPTGSVVGAPSVPAAAPAANVAGQAAPADAGGGNVATAGTPAAPAAPAAPAKPPKPPKVEQNGVTSPGVGTTTARIWEIADSISASIKAPAPRADVMKQAAAESINAATAATQYGKWRKFNGLKSEPKPPRGGPPIP